MRGPDELNDQKRHRETARRQIRQQESYSALCARSHVRCDRAGDPVPRSGANAGVWQWRGIVSRAAEKKKSDHITVKLVKAVKTDKGNYKFNQKFVQLEDISKVSELK